MPLNTKSPAIIFIGILVISLLLNTGYDRYFYQTDYHAEVLVKSTAISANVIRSLNQPVNITYAGPDLLTKILGEYKTYIEVGWNSIYFIELFVLIAAVLMWPVKYYHRILMAMLFVPIWYGLSIVKIAAAYMVEAYYPLQAHWINSYIVYCAHILLLILIFLLWARMISDRSSADASS